MSFGLHQGANGTLLSVPARKGQKAVQLDEQAASECRRVLSAFFAEMTEWEQYMEQAGFEDPEAVPRLLAIWEKYVSEKPRPGYLPLDSHTVPRAPTRGKNS